MVKNKIDDILQDLSEDTIAQNAIPSTATSEHKSARDDEIPDASEFDEISDFGEDADGEGGRAKSIHVQIKRPKRDKLIWLHPEWRKDIRLLPDPKDDRRLFVPTRGILEAYFKYSKPYRLIPYASPFGEIALWPVTSGSDNTYSLTALKIAKKFHSRWITIEPNLDERAYRVVLVNEGGAAP
jgi:hypothetical protein